MMLAFSDYSNLLSPSTKNRKRDGECTVPRPVDHQLNLVIEKAATSALENHIA